MKKKHFKPVGIRDRWILFSVFTMSFCLSVSAYGMQPKLDFDVTVQAADLIFIGTVKDKTCRYNTKGNMIFTDVMFEQIELIQKKNPARPAESDTLTLTFAGGQVGNVSLSVSDSPALEVGQKYLIFLYPVYNFHYNQSCSTIPQHIALEIMGMYHKHKIHNPGYWD